MIRTAVALIAVGLLAAGCGRKDDAPATPPPAQSQSPGATTIAGAASAVQQPGAQAPKGCEGLPDSKALAELVAGAPTRGNAGGFAEGKNEWAAVVNRDGELCALAVAAKEPAVAWPGSKGIAKAKAYTANAFSSDTVPMSTARLYTMSLPGHSLWSAANGNPLNPKCLTAPNERDEMGLVCGGTIAFGGGLPLYKDKTRIGGLGVSGDTPCADHEIAKRIREAAGLAPEKGNLADDIIYAGVDAPSIFQHPLCPNTWRNGEPVGEEQPLLGPGGIAQAGKPLASQPGAPHAAPTASAPASAAAAGASRPAR